MNSQNHNHLREKAEKKADRREKKKGKMKVSGGNVKKLHKILIKN